MRSLRRLLPPAAARGDDSPGFTIVEILIVMAIGAFILLLVLEALPALSRSSRNNQRRQDVQTMLAAVSRYELNDSGNFPADCNGSPACTAPGGPSPNDYFLQYVKSKLTFYTDPTQIILAHQPAGNTPTPNQVHNVDSVYIYNYQKCSVDGSSTWQGAGYTDVVALYALESGNNASSNIPQCQQL